MLHRTCWMLVPLQARRQQGPRRPLWGSSCPSCSCTCRMQSWAHSCSFWPCDAVSSEPFHKCEAHSGLLTVVQAAGSGVEALCKLSSLQSWVSCHAVQPAFSGFPVPYAAILAKVVPLCSESHGDTPTSAMPSA